MDFMTFFKKIEPLVGVCVLITLIYLGTLLYENNQQQKEIAKTCGYDAGEDYTCYCQKGYILEKQIELENRNNAYKGVDFLDGGVV